MMTANIHPPGYMLPWPIHNKELMEEIEELSKVAAISTAEMVMTVVYAEVGCDTWNDYD